MDLNEILNYIKIAGLYIVLLIKNIGIWFWSLNLFWKFVLIFCLLSLWDGARFFIFINILRVIKFFVVG